MQQHIQGSSHTEKTTFQELICACNHTSGEILKITVVQKELLKKMPEILILYIFLETVLCTVPIFAHYFYLLLIIPATCFCQNSLLLQTASKFINL